MTRERLVQGILQSVATVAFLPQIRLVIETLFPNRHQAVYHELGYWKTPGLRLFEKTMKEHYAPRIRAMLLGFKREAEETLAWLAERNLVIEDDADDHHPRDENGELIDTGCPCHHPQPRTFVSFETGGPYGPYGSPGV